jgi:hypothetical protein
LFILFVIFALPNYLFFNPYIQATDSCRLIFTWMFCCRIALAVNCVAMYLSVHNDALFLGSLLPISKIIDWLFLPVVYYSSVSAVVISDVLHAL